MNKKEIAIIYIASSISIFSMRQNDNTLPVNEIYSELISKSGTYEINVEIFNQKYTESISMTETLRVK